VASCISRIGVLTGGGDCPGLNAVIRAVTKDAISHGIEVVGILDGFLGLIEDRVRPLREEDVSGILTLGGTILGASNRSHPAHFEVGRGPDGSPRFEDVTPRCLATIATHGLDALVVVGGDGTMEAAQGLVRAGINCIGIPKTIDNDVRGTDLTFGFLSAVSIATEAIDRVHTTAASHHRVIAVEVMGRNAGWIALASGVASGSDVVLIPEIPFAIRGVCAAIEERRSRGKRYSIVCVAEGAAPRSGEPVVLRRDVASPNPVRLGGVAQRITEQVEADTGVESRYVVLGHVQRGGTPVAADRVLGTQFGHQAMGLLRSGAWNRMVARQGGQFTDVDLAIAASGCRVIPQGDPLIAAARAVGTSFGDL
jgi:ATP-dependent phosphofructokinase / diphosphate-dependent phosphofructokinase